jgi:hypothetical protein
MKLRLDFTQRLNIHALMGQQRCNLDEIRAFWRLQDEIRLTKEEEKAIGYRVIEGQNGGPQGATWNLTGQQATEYVFNDDDYARIRKVVREWQPGFLAAGDRLWLEPLLAQFDVNERPAAESNGKKKASAAN